MRSVRLFADMVNVLATNAPCTAMPLKRFFFVATGLAFASVMASCADSADGPDDRASCIGIFLTGPEIGDEDSQNFTINELMAHSSAMGMTQEDAETLLYLKGISPNHKLAPGETLCIET